jgi:uncharacterized protein
VRITLAELELHRVIATETYAPGSLDFKGAEFRQTAPLNVTATAELVGTEIRVRGHLATVLQAICDRCLSPVEIPVNRDFDLIYRSIKSIAQEEEIEIPEDEMEVGFYAGDGIELSDVATEQVILSLPMKVVCGDNCRGLCPVCGVNRNLTPCDCAPPPPESAFASLKD